MTNYEPGKIGIEVPEGEEFRDVEGYEGVYMISKGGRLLSLKQKKEGRRDWYDKKFSQINSKYNLGCWQDQNLI